MKTVLTFLVLAALTVTAHAVEPPKPKTTFGVKAGIGGVAVFKDGLTPGGMTLRLDITMQVPVSGRVGIGLNVGAVMPFDAFRPIPRAGVALTLRLSEHTSVAIGPGYQYNAGYSGKPDSHFVGLGFGPSYRTGQFAVGFTTGPGWTSGVNLWGWLFQPWAGITF